MKVFATMMLIGLLAMPVMAQEQAGRQPTRVELALDNLNLRLRIMQLEAQNIRAQRDRLKARLDKQRNEAAQKAAGAPVTDPQN